MKIPVCTCWSFLKLYRERDSCRACPFTNVTKFCHYSSAVQGGIQAHTHTQIGVIHNFQILFLSFYFYINSYTWIKLSVNLIHGLFSNQLHWSLSHTEVIIFTEQLYYKGDEVIYQGIQNDRREYKV